MHFSISGRRCSLPMAPVVALVVALSCTSALAQSLTLDRAVAQAAARSQLVVAAAAQTQAAREAAAAAGQLPDPVLKLGLNNLPIDGPDRYSVSRDFMTMRSVGVMQELTRNGKREARAQHARSEVDSSLIAQQVTVAALQRDAALAWLERSFQESMREQLQMQIGQSELQVEAATTLYRTGKGTQADVFAAHGQLEHLRDRLSETDGQIAIATTLLARWVGDDAVQPLAPRPPLTLPPWTQGDLSEHLARHPQIAMGVQQEALAQSEAALAQAAKDADWTAEITLSQRGAAYSNMVSVNVSVPLQWDQKNRQDRELAARLAGVDQARARREDMQRQHQAEVRAMLQEWQSDEERLRRFDASLLPLAQQRSAAALTAYQAGSGTLPLVLEGRRSELDLRMERLRLEMERARLWAQLNFLLPSHGTAP